MNAEAIYDPIDSEIQRVRQLEIGEIGVDDILNNRAALKIIIDERILNLTELRALNKQLDNHLNQAEALKGDRESLRIEVAKLRERESNSWAANLVSILVGFALSMLAGDPRSVTGWIVFFLSLVVVILLQFRVLGGKEKTSNVHS